MLRYANCLLSRLCCVPLVLLVLCGTGQSQSTTRVDISKCFSEVLVTEVTQNVVTNYLYVYLSLVTEDDYKKIQADSSAMALLPSGFFKGDWNAFQEERRHYFEMHSENIHYYQSIATNVKYLPGEWRGTIDNCINRLTQNFGYGVLYLPIYDDPDTVMLELKYRTLSRTDRIPRVRSAQLDNARVINAKGETVPLYRDCYFASVDFTCPSLDSRSEFILKRSNPNKKVHMVLNLDNDQSTAFDIDILPKKQQCHMGYDNSPTQTDTRNVEIHTPPDSVLLDETWGSEPNRLQLYLIQLQYPGRIVDGTCSPIDSFNHVMNNDPNQIMFWRDFHHMRHNPDWNDQGGFQCLGMTNTGDKRNTQIIVHYQIPQPECADVDWPTSSTTAAAMNR
jgi:hypothetical protein